MTIASPGQIITGYVYFCYPLLLFIFYFIYFIYLWIMHHCTVPSSTNKYIYTYKIQRNSPSIECNPLWFTRWLDHSDFDLFLWIFLRKHDTAASSVSLTGQRILQNKSSCCIFVMAFPSCLSIICLSNWYSGHNNKTCISSSKLLQNLHSPFGVGEFRYFILVPNEALFNFWTVPKINPILTQQRQTSRDYRTIGAFS